MKGRDMERERKKHIQRLRVEVYLSLLRKFVFYLFFIFEKLFFLYIQKLCIFYMTCSYNIYNL